MFIRFDWVGQEKTTVQAHSGIAHIIHHNMNLNNSAAG